MQRRGESQHMQMVGSVCSWVKSGVVRVEMVEGREPVVVSIGGAGCSSHTRKEIDTR